MPSRANLRQRLRQLTEEHDHLLQIAFESSPLWRGLVYEGRRKCGKPNCHCAQGEPHVSPVFADRSEGPQRNFSLHGADLELFRKMTEAYRKVRAHRRRIVKVQRELLQIFDALESARRTEGERRYARRLAPEARTRGRSKKP